MTDDDECRVDHQADDDGDGGAVVVHLGFIEPVDDGGEKKDKHQKECEWIGHRSPQYDLWDGGQVGGRPSFLDPENLPMKPITCESCNNVVMKFVCQIYAPIDEYEERAFHRTLYVFCCPNSNSSHHHHHIDSIRVLRVQLPQENPYFPFESSSAGDDWNKHLSSTYNIQLCQVCGMRGPFKCPLQGRYFCSKQHQKEHKKYVFDRLLLAQNGRRTNKESEHQQAARTCSTLEKSDDSSRSCTTSCSAAFLLPSVYPFAGLVVGEEENDDDDDDTDNDGNNKAKNRKTLFDNDGDDTDCSDRDLEQDDLNLMTGRRHTVETDDTTANFQRKCKANPWQVLRYARTWAAANNENDCNNDDDGDHHHPLWIRADHQPDPEHDIPPCPYCKAPRKFEFQLMPQLLHGLERLQKQQQQQQQQQSSVLDNAASASSAKSNVGLVVNKGNDETTTKNERSGQTTAQDSDESKYRQVVEAVQQAEDFIQQAPPEQIPPSLVEAKEAAVERLRQERFGLIASSSSTGSNKNTGTTKSDVASSGIDAVDWGIVAIYTCTKSCNGGEPAEGVTVVDPVLGTYREEFAWRQPSLDVP